MADDDLTPTIAHFLQMLADNLDRHMSHQGISEAGLAQACGISPRTVGNFLRPGNRHTIRGTSKAFPSGTIANLVRIAAALDVDVWKLLVVDKSKDTNTHKAKFIAAVEQAYRERHRTESSKQR